MNYKTILKPMMIGVVSLFLLAGCASMSKMMMDMMIGKTDDLNKTNIEVKYYTNIYPEGTESVTSSVMGTKEEPWEAGRDFVFTAFLEKGSTSIVPFMQLEGNVNYNGTSAPYLGAGHFGKSYSGSAPDKISIDITSMKGQNLKFNVDKAPRIKIISINGQKNGAFKLDPSKGLKLKLQVPRNLRGKYMTAWLTFDAFAAKAFNPLAIFKAQETVYLSPQVLRHGQTGNNASTNFDSDNYLLIKLATEKQIKHAKHNIKVIYEAMDGKPIEIIKDIDLVATTQATVELDGGFKANVSTRGAMYSKPLKSARKLALVNLTIDGTLVTTETSTSTNGDREITTTNTWQFPDKPLKDWDTYMGQVYKDVRDVFASEYRVSFLPRSKVTAAKAYQAMAVDFEEKYTSSIIKHSYQGAKPIKVPTTDANPVDINNPLQKTTSPYKALMKELGVDGLVFVTISSVVPKTEVITLSSKMNIQVIGYGVTKDTSHMSYLKASFETGEGRGTNNALYKIMRQDHVRQTLKTGAQKLDAMNKENGFYDVWALR
ncbi:MAG: hypothetical protein Q9M44_03250 [Ghiorsea sp.]|nr:hypothetical protein [Ghiorsea sp.]